MVSPKDAANAAWASAWVVAAASPGSGKLDVALERRRAAHRREEEGRGRRGRRGRRGFLGLVASLGQEGGCSVRNVKEGAVLQARWVEKKGVIR